MATHSGRLECLYQNPHRPRRPEAHSGTNCAAQGRQETAPKL